VAYDIPDRAGLPRDHSDLTGIPPYPDVPRYPGYPPYPPQPPTNGMAVASMVLGIVGITIGWFLMAIPSVLAVIFGHVALGTMRRTGQQGRGMAIAGLVTGYIVVGVVAVLLLAALAG
jgi:hypothetical protein